MKSKILMVAAALTMIGSLSVAPSAQAYPGHGFGNGGGWHGGGWHGGGWHGGGRGYYGLGLGLAAGALLTYPYYSGYYSDYYSPTYVDSGSVAVYEDSPSQTQVAPNTSAAPMWYYCDSPKGYYPYVHSCPSGWQKVPATPPH